MVCHQKDFAQERLPLSPRERRDQAFAVALLEQGLEAATISLDGLQRLAPCRPVRRSGILRPVVFGPLHRLVASIVVPAIVQDVALRDADVLHNLPCRVRQFLYYRAAQPGRKPLDRVVKADMSLSAIQECLQFLLHSVNDAIPALF